MVFFLDQTALASWEDPVAEIPGRLSPFDGLDLPKEGESLPGEPDSAQGVQDEPHSVLDSVKIHDVSSLVQWFW